MKSNLKQLFLTSTSKAMTFRSLTVRNLSRSVTADCNTPVSSTPMWINRVPTPQEMDEYKKNFTRNWLNIAALENNGRVFSPPSTLSQVKESPVFPNVRADCLDGTNAQLPAALKSKAKLISFSFKHYGFDIVRKWNDYVHQKYFQDTKIDTIELCYVEFGFLSMAKSLYINNIKRSIPNDRHKNTFVVFGGIQDLAHTLLLPSIFTGYVFLLDRNNQIRWKACGEPTEQDLILLNQCIETLKNER